MSLQFFKDSALTRPVTGSSPVWIFSPLGGAIKHVSLWLADAYSTPLQQTALAGATSLRIQPSPVFPAAGSVVVAGQVIAYSANNSGVLTVPVLGVTIPAGTPVYPLATYSGLTNLMMTPAGSVKAALKRPDQVSYGIPNTGVIYTFSSAAAVDVTGPLVIAQIDLEITIPAGDAAELADLRIQSSALSPSTFPGQLFSPQAVFRIERQDQGLQQRFRIYPANRIIAPSAPGFVFGQYRWRDELQMNGDAVLPTQWDLDVNQIGREKFIAGIGDGTDLEPLSLEKQDHSIFARVKPGFYWTGPDRYYLPSDDSVCELVPIGEYGCTIPLTKQPRPQCPIFVGTLKTDAEGYYDADARFEFMAVGFDPDGADYQFTLDRANQSITLNTGLAAISRQFLGMVPPSTAAVFDLPIYPVSYVSRVVMGAYGTSPEQDVPSFVVDQTAGTITVSFPDTTTYTGRELFVECQPAVLIVYEENVPSPQNSLLGPVDLNPAFAGIPSGFLYLEQRKRRAAAIELFCDKPRIVTPQQYSMVSGLISFGPVFYENDFAQLQAVAYSAVSGEVVPGATLAVTPVSGSPFSGRLNYKDPNSETVTIVTGADGVANLVYTPPDAFGQYLATSSISGTDVHLPAPIPVQQLWNANDGHLARLYAVYNNDPFFGKSGANTAYGEIPWQTIGTAGSTSYQTNGKRVLISAGSNPLLPAGLYDVAGHERADTLFDGIVVTVRYAGNVPTDSTIGSYFLTMIGRILLQVQAVDTGIVSNAILLDLAAPPVVVDESGVSGYLTLNEAASGRLNVNRLGGAPILPCNVNTSRY